MERVATLLKREDQALEKVLLRRSGEPGERRVHVMRATARETPAWPGKITAGMVANVCDSAINQRRNK